MKEYSDYVNEGSDSAVNTPALSDSDELIDAGDAIDFNSFQVVRREFFAHMREPSITFNAYKFSVNTACVMKFPYADAVQVLVNSDRKILALRPCKEGERDSFIWCRNAKGKRMPKTILCRLFFAKIMALMEWNPSYRYKMLGNLVQANGEYLLVFDLSAAEVYKRVPVDGERTKASRVPIYPEEWKNQFGMPFDEHQQSLQINIFEGYAIYAIKDKTKSSIVPGTGALPVNTGGGEANA